MVKKENSGNLLKSIKKQDLTLRNSDRRNFVVKKLTNNVVLLETLNTFAPALVNKAALLKADICNGLLNNIRNKY